MAVAMSSLCDTVVFLLTILCVSVFFIFMKLFRKLWWEPVRMQRFMLSQGIHGPPFRFFFGNKLENMKMRMEAMNRPLDLSDHHILPRVHPDAHLFLQKYGKNYLQWDGCVPELMVSDVETVKELLHNKEKAVSKQEFVGDALRVFGNGIVNSHGPKWAKARRIADHAFHGDLLKNMVPTMVSCAEAMLENWKKHYEGKEIDLFEEFRVFSSDIISHTAFGSSYVEGKMIFDNLSKLTMMVFISQYKSAFLPGISKLYRSKQEREGDEIVRKIKASIADIVKEREDKVKSGEAVNYGNDYLGSLLKVKNDKDKNQRISLDDVLDECKTMYFAGQETTGVALSWTTFLLAIHTDWQEEARKEVVRLFGDKNPTLDGITKLKTLSMIIKESLRLYTPGPIMVRTVKKEARLGKLVVPANTQICILVTALHHDPEIWGEDAHEFKPERFSETKATNIPPAAYIPFGMGARNCVGSALSLNEIKIVMSMILQRFSFTISPAHVHAPYQFLALSAQHGVRVNLKSLNK